MAAGSTYSQIATTTLGSSTTSYTFSNVPQTYTNLVVVMAVIPTGSLGYAPWFQFNSDTGSNYSVTYMAGNGTSASSGRQSSQTKGWTGYSIGLSASSNVVAHILQYTNTSTYKSYVNRINDTSGSFPGAGAGVGLWRNTAAISTIKIGTDGTFDTGSTFTLYGIKGA